MRWIFRLPYLEEPQVEHVQEEPEQVHAEAFPEHVHPVLEAGVDIFIMLYSLDQLIAYSFSTLKVSTEKVNVKNDHHPQKNVPIGLLYKEVLAGGGVHNPTKFRE